MLENKLNFFSHHNFNSVLSFCHAITQKIFGEEEKLKIHLASKLIYWSVDIKIEWAENSKKFLACADKTQPYEEKCSQHSECCVVDVV
jgi:hypothetical protein